MPTNIQTKNVIKNIKLKLIFLEWQHLHRNMWCLRFLYDCFNSCISKWPLHQVYFHLSFIIQRCGTIHINAGVNFIITKCRRFKRQNMAFKRQKWCLTFREFHKTFLLFVLLILTFKTPKKRRFKLQKRSV